MFSQVSLFNFVAKKINMSTVDDDILLRHTETISLDTLKTDLEVTLVAPMQIFPCRD